MRKTISFSNGIGVKSRKYVCEGYSPTPSLVKNNLPVMLENASANN